MNSKLLATTNHIIAKMPHSDEEGDVRDGIIIPKGANLKKEDVIVELEILSAGPDCKVAREGDTVVFNKLTAEKIPWQDGWIMRLAEGTAIGVVRNAFAAQTTS